MDVIANILSQVANAITSSWAYLITVIGVFLSIAAWLLGGDHDHKGKMTKTIIAGTLLLGLGQFLAWIRP